MTKTRK